MSDDERRLLERVLDEQRATRADLSTLQLLAQRQHGECMTAIGLMGAKVAELEEDHDKLDARHRGHVRSTDKRLGTVEKRLIVIGTTCTVVGTLAGVLWKVLGG